MTQKKTVVCVIGTRPEAIKMAPVVHALHASSWARCVVVATAQHRGLLDQMLTRLSVPVDHDLDLMANAQSPSGLLARMLPALDAVLEAEMPALVLAQGDTATVFGAALCAFHHRIPFGHVEAGLRTHDLMQPYPEEGYRQMIARITRWHFAPTEGAAEALRQEGIDPNHIHITGNTCIDTLLQTVAQLGSAPNTTERLILLTTHRRENFGEPLKSIFTAVRDLAEKFQDVRIIYPVHPNPNVKNPALEILSGHPRINLCEPLDYFEFVDLMRQANFILTDSGGIQEEAPALGKPVLVLRENTERPEAVLAGAARLVGTSQAEIVKAATELLTVKSKYAAMSLSKSPFGDGHASIRILDIIANNIAASRAN